MKGRELAQNDILWAERMLGRINKSAAELFRAAVTEGNIETARIYEYEDNRGIISVIRGENYYSVQVSFEQDVHSYEIINEIEREVQQVVSAREKRDVYLNVNGYNVLLCNVLMDLGFMRDDLGFEFVLNKQDSMVSSCMAVQNNSEITVKAYEEEHAQEYLCLLDDAFRRQNEECGQEQDVYKNVYADYQNNKMKQANESGDFFAFWLNEKLLGLCLFHKDYLDTIAVAPEFEGKGYGSKIMEICIRDRWLVKNYSEIYLHTYMQNRRAQRLYMKYGFELQGFYSENTFAEGGTNV